jgi:hypothetical protein
VISPPTTPGPLGRSQPHRGIVVLGAICIVFGLAHACLGVLFAFISAEPVYSSTVIVQAGDQSIEHVESATVSTYQLGWPSALIAGLYAGATILAGLAAIIIGIAMLARRFWALRAARLWSWCMLGAVVPFSIFWMMALSAADRSPEDPILSTGTVVLLLMLLLWIIPLPLAHLMYLTPARIRRDIAHWR